MQVYKCDRCGKIIEVPFEDKYSCSLSLLGLFDLCENCYQTIKEVLNDGEIK